MQLARLRKLQDVFIYKQVKAPEALDSFKCRADFVGDINSTGKSRKRVLGKSARAMATTLALNLDADHRKGICLRVNAKGFEEAIRNGATIPLTDTILPLEGPEIMTVLRLLENERIREIKIDET